MIKDILRVLGKLKLFTVSGILALISSLLKLGVNLQVILRVAVKLYPQKVALVYEGEVYTYERLYEKISNLKVILHEKYKLNRGKRIAIACANHPSFIFSLFASSGLALDVYLLNYALSEKQFKGLLELHKFDFIIYDDGIESYIQNADYSAKSLSSSLVVKYADIKSETVPETGKTSFNKIIVLTSGTTGISVAASRKASVFAYLCPLITLSAKLKFWNYESLYIAPPIYHGFGLVTLLISFILGKKVYIRKEFDAAEACKLIAQNKIDCVTLVPAMLYRMLSVDTTSLQSLQCIISGGSVLPSAETRFVQENLGDKLYNLYGSSEAGICIMALPEDLRYSDKTIGKVLSGTKVIVADKNDRKLPVGEVGQLLVKSGWSIAPNQWVKTGDMAYMDKNGYFFLKGRIDDMIISGGENVFPSELEEILNSHPSIENAMVVGIDDRDMGQRLKAFVVPVSGTNPTEKDIMSWLSNRAARHQMPKEICFLDEIPLNQMGKRDKKQLR